MGVAIQYLESRGRARALAIGVAYFVLASASLLLTRLDGGVAFIWLGNALLLAELDRLGRRSWDATLLTCAVASFAATALFGVGLLAAPAMAAANIFESCLGAYMMRRLVKPFGSFSSPGGTVTLAVVAMSSAAISGLFASAAITMVTEHSFQHAWTNWTRGHALGMIAFTPLLLIAVRGELTRGWSRLTVTGLVEAGCYALINLAIALIVFGQSRYPLAFLPLLPLIATTFRYGRTGAALSVALLALVGGTMTVLGYGPAQLMPVTDGQRLQFLQVYFAVAVLAVLPVAAVLEKRDALIRQLGEQEARFRALADRSGDVILELTCDGVIRYASPSIAELGEFDPASVTGSPMRILIHPRHHRRVIAARARAVAEPNVPVTAEFLVADGGVRQRWVETSSRAILDKGGIASGVVCVLRDITDRKLAEAEQARAASTDSLTGIANRRSFVAALATPTTPGPRQCAVLDLDHFKQINDAHGHDAGDRALQGFATLAVEFAGPGSLVARIGGEEFAVLFTGIDMVEAAHRCERLCRATADMRVPLRNGRVLSFTVSAGLVGMIEGDKPDATLAAADTALYRAKAGGRNRVAIAGEPMLAPANGLTRPRRSRHRSLERSSSDVEKSERVAEPGRA